MPRDDHLFCQVVEHYVEAVGESYSHARCAFWGGCFMPVDVRVRMLGSFGLTIYDGRQIALSGAKDRALICLLCFARGRRMPRALLQDKLWSDRGQEQGAASLRSSLTNIRKALGEHRNVLLSDRRAVGLDCNKVTADIDDLAQALADYDMSSQVPELFEDLINIDSEFDDWARDRRSEFEDRAAVHFAEREPSRRAQRRSPQAVRVLFETPGAQPPKSVASEFAVDGLITTLSEAGGLELVMATFANEQERANTDFSLMAREWSEDDRAATSMSLVARATGQLLWKQTSLKPSAAEEADLHQAVNMASDSALTALRQHFSYDSETAQARLGSLIAVTETFRGRGRNGNRIRRLLESSFERDRKGIHLAWQGFLSTYLVGERLTDDPRGAIEESESLIRRALELDPANSMVLALGSYVYSFLHHDFFTGYELASRAAKLNPSNPLAWSFLGCASVYLGRFEKGYEHCTYARRISGPGPHRYMIDTLCFIAAASVGKLDEALALAETTRRQVAGYAPPLRYLIAIYRFLGETERAEETIGLLKKIEPDFTPEIMREQAYPMRALRSSDLFVL